MMTHTVVNYRKKPHHTREMTRPPATSPLWQGKPRSGRTTYMLWLKMSGVFESAFSHKSSCRHMFHRNLLGVLDPPPLFPTTLVTESGTTCAGPWSGSCFGRVGSITGHELKDLIEMSSGHAPINFPSKKEQLHRHW